MKNKDSTAVKPFTPLTSELSVGEKMLKEKLDLILDNYYILTDKDFRRIDNIVKGISPSPYKRSL